MPPEPHLLRRWTQPWRAVDLRDVGLLESLPELFGRLLGALVARLEASGKDWQLYIFIEPLFRNLLVVVSFCKPLLRVLGEVDREAMTYFLLVRVVRGYRAQLRSLPSR